MSDASTVHWDAPAMHAGAMRVPRARVPLHAWSRRRRVAVAAMVGAAACVLATGLCMTADFAGAAAANAALTAARRELADAQRAQQALPALKRAAASAAFREPRHGRNSADDARDVSELAATSGISVVSLAPGTSGGQGAEAFRVLKLTAQGDFPQVRSFLHRLAYAPVLIVPTDAAIERTGSQLLLTATLSIFDLLPPLPAPAANAAAATTPDPFAKVPADDARTVDGLRLAGLMQDRTHALALIETPAGTDAVKRGSRIEGQRVVRIAAPQVTLAAGGTTRVLTWSEDGQ